LCLLLFVGCCLAQANAQLIAVRAGHLVDPATGTVKDNQVILIKDGKITEIGPTASIPANAAVMNLSSEWVLPGLVEAT